MLPCHSVRSLALLVSALTFGNLCPGDEAVQPPGQLTLNATVLMPDGSPAAAAAITSENNIDNVTKSVTTDGHGRFELSDVFVNSLSLDVVAQDGRHQASMMVPEAAVRKLLDKPMTITLKSASPYLVKVVVGGEPVPEVTVAMTGVGFRRFTTTDARGRCVIWYPAGMTREYLVAWHPELGTNGIRSPGGSGTQLELLTPKPHTVRVLDQHGTPVAGVTVSTSVRTEDSDWIMAKKIPATHNRTDELGEAQFDWFPTDAKYVDVDLVGSRWKYSGRDRENMRDALTIVHARQMHQIDGRVAMPDGVTAEGLLVTGFGFGPASGFSPYARTRKDGTFTMSVLPEYGCIFGVSDLEWSSPLWSGIVLGSETDRQQEIVLNAHPATPVEIRLTRGESHQPVADALVHFDQSASVAFMKASGKPGSGHGGVRGWLLTDSEGTARMGASLGKLELRITSGEWSEEREIDIIATDPVKVDFHRDWEGERLLKIQPVLNGKPYQPTEAAVALAWSENAPGYNSKQHKPLILEDGAIEVWFDQEAVSLLLTDVTRGLAGFADVTGDTKEIELPMKPMASFSGTMLDDFEDRPLANQTIRMITRRPRLDVVEPVQTDDQGRYTFPLVPSEAPLWLDFQGTHGQANYLPNRRDRTFKPGEQRRGDIERARLMAPNGEYVQREPELPASERLQRAVDTAELEGLRVLVLVAGKDSANAVSFAARLRNREEAPAIERYLPVTVTANEQKNLPSELTSKWPVPAEHELSVLMLGNETEVAASMQLDCTDVNSAVRQGAEFLDQEISLRNGRQRLRNAQALAKDSGRSVWVLTGERQWIVARRLSGWVMEHAPVLQKDLVIVKLTDGLDEDALETRREIGGDDNDLLFHAFLSPDGKLLINSESPLGNVAMPTTLDGIRHFETMLKTVQRNLSDDDVAELIESLSGNTAGGRR